MKKLILIIFLQFIFYNFLSAQGIVYDDFSKKDLPDWIWGGLEMKYSHATDNKENGYAELHSKLIVKPNSYIGKITKLSPVLFTAGNFLNAMFKGVKNDIYIKFQVLYDIDNNGIFNDDKDIMLESKQISLKFDGWKEIKIKFDEENFKIISNYKDDFSVTEEEALGIQFEFETGKNYKESKFDSGIALISEIVNKDNLVEQNYEQSDKKEDESYFEAKNYPNPFNPVTTISYNLKQSGHVTLTVYDRLGREVKVLVDETQNAGTHTVDFNASNLPSGIYFYRIKFLDHTEVRKMLFTK